MSIREAEEKEDAAARSIIELGDADEDRAFALLKRLKGAEDLLRPSLWDAWSRASDGLFQKAVAELRTKEQMERLERATEAHGRNWIAFFCVSPAKVKALIERGVDPSARSCDFINAKVEAGLLCCLLGRPGALRALEEGGAPPPGRVGDELAERLSRRSGATPLQILIQSWRGDQLGGIYFPQAARWLCSGGIEVSEADAAGDDALKLAIRSEKFTAALALLDIGARPEDKNARGQDALAELREVLGAEGALGGQEPPEGVGELLARLEEARLGEELGSSRKSGPGFRV